MKKNFNGKTPSSLIRAILAGSIMFLFYRYSDHAPLNMALSKAVVFTVLFGVINMLIENVFGKRAKNNTEK